MKKIIVMLGLLGGVIFLGSDVNAAECQHFYRMSGRCGDAPSARVVHHPVKSQQKPQKKPQVNSN
jgi:hypothetical protein